MAIAVIGLVAAGLGLIASNRLRDSREQSAEPGSRTPGTEAGERAGERGSHAPKSPSTSEPARTVPEKGENAG